MLVVLHGAKKNAGDFLIHERGVRILAELLPDQELVSRPRWRPVDRELADRAEAIVLCGGPGLAQKFYPGVFPLVPDLATLRTPVLPLALGWSGRPVGRADDMRFTSESRGALALIHRRIEWSTVRDDVSLRVLAAAEVGPAKRSGCFAWYHLPSLGRAMSVGREIRSLVFTPPAGIRWMPQARKLLRLLARRFPSADRYCVFHRGVRADEYTSRSAAFVNARLAHVAERLGYRVVDAGFDLRAIDFYGATDLHVGYRVHAHLSFLSQRRPSLLIAEDGRGVGQNMTLGDPYLLHTRSKDLVARVADALAQEARTRFAGSERAIAEIERTWPVMRDSVLQLARRGGT